MTIFDHLVLFWGQSALVQKYGSLVHLALIGNGFLRTPQRILLVLVPGLPSNHMTNISSGTDLYICRADMDA